MINENTILAAAMNYPSSFPEIFQQMEIVDFTDSRKLVWKAISQLQRRSADIDPAMVVEELKQMGKFEEIGGYDGLEKISLDAKVYSSQDLTRQMDTVKFRSFRWQLYKSVGVEGNNFRKDTVDPYETLEKIKRDIDRIVSSYKTAPDETLAQIHKKAMAKIKRMKSGDDTLMSTGYSIDALLNGGFRPGQMIVIGARPGEGKTALALNIALSAANGLKGAFFSFEMTKIELMNRFIANRSGVFLSKLLSPKYQLNPYEQNKIAELEFPENLTIVDKADVATVSKISAYCQKIKKTRGLDFVVIDYLGLLKAEGRSLNEKMTNISREIKLMAMGLEVPVLALCQLNRDAVKGNKTGAIELFHLRDSGSIEQDADVVMFIQQKADVSEGRRLTEISIKKNRNGKAGNVELYFDGNLQNFKELFS